MMSSPFTTVTGVGETSTHLVVSSPAIPGTRADELPTATLCGVLVDQAVAVPAAEVGCGRCLYRASEFMHLPGYVTVGVR